MTDGDLRLGSTFAVEGPGSQRTAIRAGAIPLGKAPARGRAQDFNAHSCGLQRGACVSIDLAIQTDFFELRRRPFHGRTLRGAIFIRIGPVCLQTFVM